MQTRPGRRWMLAAGILAVGLLVTFGVAFRLGAFSGDDEQETLWKVQTEEMIFSSPVSENGVVYIGNYSGYLHALDARTGVARWRFTADAAAATPSSTPVLAAATPSSTPVRERALSGHYSINSIAVSDGVVYAGSSDNNLYAIDATTGRERWRFTTLGSIYSTPVIVAGVVYVGSYDHHLYAIDAAMGTERWRFATMDSVESDPGVFAGVVYVGSRDHHLYAIDASTGRERWRFATNGPVTSPALVSGAVYVSSHVLYAIDAATGTERWRFQTERSIEALSPSFADGIVYIASRHGALDGIDAQTGVPVWELNWEKETDTGFFLVSSPHVVNGIVYLPVSDTLYAFPAPERPSRTHDDGDAVSIHVVPAVTDRSDVARPQSRHRTGQRRVAGGAAGRGPDRRGPADRRGHRARLRQPGRRSAFDRNGRWFNRANRGCRLTASFDARVVRQRACSSSCRPGSVRSLIMYCERHWSSPASHSSSWPSRIESSV